MEIREIRIMIASQLKKYPIGCLRDRLWEVKHLYASLSAFMCLCDNIERAKWYALHHEYVRRLTEYLLFGVKPNKLFRR